MSGFTTQTIDHVIRSNLWTSNLKDIFEDELMGMRYVRQITDFPDGDLLNIPSIGQMEAQDYAEDQSIEFTAMDTGNFTFQITEYKASGTYITDQFRQDSYISDQIAAAFVPKMSRALMVQLEHDVLDIGPNGQTASDPNTINDAHHRYVASGTNEVMTVEDFAKARYALQKAYVPLTNLVAIVDPSVEIQLATQPNVVNLLSPNPRWSPIVNEGISTGMQFRFNIYGFDVYTSDHLKKLTASETITAGDGGRTVTAGVTNLFFSAAGGDTLPFIGQFRQSPKVESKRNIDRQRDEYVTTMRYGLGFYRPENFVCVLTDTDQVYA